MILCNEFDFVRCPIAGEIVLLLKKKNWISSAVTHSSSVFYVIMLVAFWQVFDSVAWIVRDIVCQCPLWRICVCYLDQNYKKFRFPEVFNVWSVSCRYLSDNVANFWKHTFRTLVEDFFTFDYKGFKMCIVLLLIYSPAYLLIFLSFSFAVNSGVAL